jgi:Tol biopolymer transport system component
MKHYIKYLTLISILTSCLNQKHEERINVYGPEFDISKDNRKIVCSFYEDNKAGIYEIDITSKNRRRLSPSSRMSLIKPIYSPDNDKVACISEPLIDEIKSKICLIDISSKEIDELTADTLLILECVFSPNGEQIYFSGSKYYGNYSPIAHKAPHEIDIYSVDIKSKRTKQITNFNSYNLHSISINNAGDSLLFHLDSKTKQGLFLMNIHDKGLKQIFAKNDLRAEKKLSPYEYYLPVLSKDNLRIAFSEPYELYIMDRQTGISKLIFRNEPYLVNVAYYIFFYNYNYLILTLPSNIDKKDSSGDNFGFFTLNPETKELRTLDIQ